MNDNAIAAAFAGAEPVEIPADMRAPGWGDNSGDNSGDGPPAIPRQDDDGPEAVGAEFPATDYGNGQRLVHYFGDDLVFIPRLGWFVWDGRRWVSDEDEIAVRRYAQAISARIEAEIPFVALNEAQRDDLQRWRDCKGDYARLDAMTAADRSDEQKARLRELEPIRDAGQAAEGILSAKRKAHLSLARASGNTVKIRNMMAEAVTLCGKGVEAMNANKLMLNCENGVVHFIQAVNAHDASWGDVAPRWQVEFLPHARDHMISKMVSAPYDPEAQAPTWTAFLERVQPDPEVRLFLQRWFGYSVTGLTSEQKLAFLYGIGRNGKSTMVDTIAGILADYGTTIPIETLTGTEQRKGSDATPDLVRLPGARFVRASEPEQGQKMKEALIKQLTGGESIMIRRMHSEFIEIVPEFKLTISGNHKPEIRGADDGIWRRVMLVKFGEQIPDDEVDRDLPAKLEAERTGILAWLVQGAVDYLQHGLPVPDVVKEATAEYRATSDPMREFLTTECRVTENWDDFVTGRELRDCFNAWLLERALDPWGPRTVANNIAARSGVVKGPGGDSYVPAKTNGDTGYRGLTISDAARDRLAAYRDQLPGPRKG